MRISLRRILRGLLLFLVAGLVGGGLGWSGYRLWPRKLEMSRTGFPEPVLRSERLALVLPAPVVAAEVASFEDEVDAFLYFEYLRSREPLNEHRILLTATEGAKGPSYKMFVIVENDLLTAIPYLNDMRSHDLIRRYELNSWTYRDLVNARQQSRVFLAAYAAPANQELENLSAAQILPPLAKFVRFKSRTDNRVRARSDPAVQPLSPEAAHQLAADIIAVAQFYSLPLDAFLGIGAMENNYMDVRGDLDHVVWKRRPQKGDIIVRRGRRRFLVRNDSIGRWQITRETLRHAHSLYLKDTRDYSALPDRLRPSRTLDFDSLNSAELTTYAGLLFRDLLDRFGGDVEKAVGAYNGGVKNPNPAYAAGVRTAAKHARKILEHGAAKRSLMAAEQLSIAAQSRRDTANAWP